MNSRPAKRRPSASLLWIACLLVTAGCSSSATEAAGQADRYGGVYFVQGTANGYQLAAKRGLPCLMFFTADWCTYCHQMEETAFADPTVAALAKGFVCILVDADREPEVCRQFSITGYPTVQFLSAQGECLLRLKGRQSASKLAIGMQAALERFAWLNCAESTLRTTR